MKKFSLILVCLLAVGILALLVSCAEVPSPLPIGTVPETTEYRPESLTIEFYDESDYSDMTIFRKYPADSSAAEDSAEAPEEVIDPVVS